MFQEQTFIHHGRWFMIEADDFPTLEAADAAIIYLQSWAILLEPDETHALHGALKLETEALLHDADYDRDLHPLPDVRDAQRRAIRAGLRGRMAMHRQPAISIDAINMR